MSRYQLNKLCFDLKDAANRERFAADEDAYVRLYDLDEGERSALRSRDYAAMFELGVNIYVLVTVSGISGLNLGGLRQAMIDGYTARDSGRPLASGRR